MPSDPAPDFPRKIKIVRVIARLNIGGASIHAINLTSGMDEQRFESILVAGSENPGEGSMWDLALSQDVRPVSIPEIVGKANLRLRDLKALVKLYQLLRRERPHIVDTHTAKAGFIGRVAAWLAGVPVIIHTYHGHVLQGYYSLLKGRALRAMEAALARLTDRIVAVSEETKQDLVRLKVAGEDRISVVPLGFRLDPFLNAWRLKGQFRKELGVGEDACLIGIVGRLFPVKNHRLFLDSAALVADKYEQARFVVVGDGALKRVLVAQTERLGIRDKVIFTGWRRDLPRIYADLDVLVVSSVNEGTPVAAIEAMSAGCPVVATRVGGTPSLTEDGRNGLLVEPGNPVALSEAVRFVLQAGSDFHRMSCAARQTAQKRFSLDRLIRDTGHLYEELLVSKSG